MVLEKLQDKFTRYEIARILGARSLQLAMDAPVLLKLSPEEEEELNYDTLRIAEKELEAEVLPITVRRPLPKRSGKIIKKLSEEEIKEKLEKEAEQKKKEAEEEKVEVHEEAEGEDEDETVKKTKTGDETEDEIMEMATPEDEVSEDESEEAGEEL
jgi:DNA-directed RNA polymerase subunit K